MAFPASASGWTNSNNVLANDGSYATSQAFRSEGSGDAGPSLVATGFGFSGGAGDTVNGITITLRLHYAGIGGTVSVYLLNNGIPVGTGKSISPSTSDADYVLGSGTDTWSAGFNGSNIANLQVAVYGFASSGAPLNGTFTTSVDSVQATVSMADTTPNSFDFTDVTGQSLNTVVVSNTQTISGITAPATVTISSTFGVTGEWEKNFSGSWSSGSGTVINGDVVRVRHTTSTSFSTQVTTALVIGGVTGDFKTTTIAADSTPDAFGWSDSNNNEPGAGVVGATITPTGYNTSVAYSVTGGFVGVNGSGATLTSGTLNPGDSIYPYGVASATFGGLQQVTVTIGGVAGTFNVYTRAADITPNAFAFTDVSGVPTSTLEVSNSITVSGIEAATAISITGGEYELNGSGTWLTSSGTVVNGTTVRVRHTSSASLSSSVNTTLTIGGVSDTFTSTTVGADSVPDAFSFTAKTRQLPGRLIASAAVTITGINVAVGVTCSAGAQVSVNGAAYSTTGTISNGQTLAIRVTSSRTGGATVTASATIGGVSGSFLVTTTRQLASGHLRKSMAKGIINNALALNEQGTASPKRWDIWHYQHHADRRLKACAGDAVGPDVLKLPVTDYITKTRPLRTSIPMPKPNHLGSTDTGRAPDDGIIGGGIIVEMAAAPTGCLRPPPPARPCHRR
jgi:hypothetical protein